jgi:hypothetical protein
VGVARPAGHRCQITWDGKGEPLMFGPGSTRRRFQHPTASGRYDTIAAADAAVQAFYGDVLAAEAGARGGGGGWPG